MSRVLLLLVCLTSTISAQPSAGSDKPAWDITDRERLERRFDSGASAVRRARAIAEGYAVGSDNGASFFVLGRHNPELLMRTELMGMLVVVYETDTEVGRKFKSLWWQKGIERFGPDFWTDLYGVAAPYVDGYARRQRRAREQSQRAVAATAQAVDPEDPSGTELCLLLSKALGAAREKFGAARFDAFLYEVIAPEAGQVITSSSEPHSSGDSLLWVEGGCR